MVGERFSGPDTAYPHLQHNTTREHTHQGANLVRGRGCTSPVPLSSSSRPHRPRRSPAYSRRTPSVPGKPTSGAYPVKILRPSCCVGKRPGQGAGEQGTGRNDRLPFSMHLGHPLSQAPGHSRDGTPVTRPHPPRTVVQPPPRRGDRARQPRVSSITQSRPVRRTGC